MPARNVEDNEVFLHDTWFPISGQVRLTNVTVTPQPILLGDPTKGTGTQVMAQLAQSSWSDGHGKYIGHIIDDAKRFWDSECDTRWSNSLTPPLEILTMTGSPGTPINASAEARGWGQQYFQIGSTSVQEMTASTGGFTTSLSGDLFAGTLIPYKGGIGVYRWIDGVTDVSAAKIEFWTKLTSAGAWTMLWSHTPSGWGLTTQPKPAAVYVTTFGTTVFALVDFGPGPFTGGSVDNTIRTIKDAGNDNADAVFSKPRSLFTYRDAAGAQQLFTTTTYQLFVYKNTLPTNWLPLDVVWTSHADSGKVALFADGRLYVTNGGPVIVAVQSGNPITIEDVSLNKDDGLLTTRPSLVRSLAGGSEWLFALLRDANGTQIKLYQQGPGWHTLVTQAGVSADIIALSGAHSLERVYWNQGAIIHALDLNADYFRPRFSTARRYQAGTFFHITPWFDMGATSQFKLQGHMVVQTLGCDAANHVTVDVGYDLVDGTWTNLGDIVTNGLSTFKPNASLGTRNRYVRYRFGLIKSLANTQRPLVEYYVTDYIRLLPATFGYIFTIRFNESEYKGKSAAALRAAIERISDPAQTGALVEFSFQDDYGQTQTHFAKVARLTGTVYAGLDNRDTGEYSVSVYVPYKEDSI